MGITISWRYGQKSYISSQAISNLVNDQLLELDQQEDVTMWMDLARTSRHPQHLWSIDYIESLPELETINEAIRKSEVILYGDNRSLKLREKYSADIFQEIAFHTIRAHLRSEEGHPEISVEIFEELIEDWLDEIPLIRKSNLLMHACLCFLCCQKWQQSYDCLQKHWGLLKYASTDDRENLGIWDNEVIIRMIYWFFMKHVPDFRTFYASKTGVIASSDLWKHKKMGLLWALSYDDSWVVSFCSLPLYEHARSLMPDLPAYEKKPTTVRNSILGFGDSTKIISESLSEQDRYLDLFKRIMEQAVYERDEDKANDALFSYLSFRPDRIQYENTLTRLIQFVDECGGADPLHAGSVLDVASGLSVVDIIKRKDMKLTSSYLHVDISERICRLLEKEGRTVRHSSMQGFLSKTKDYFDLCIASSCLHYLLECQIDDFLVDVSQKCLSLAAAIPLGADIVEDMIVEYVKIEDTDPFEKKRDAFIAIDINGIITEWNQNAKHVFGWSSDEVIGKMLTETIVPKNYREAQLQAMKKLQKTGKSVPEQKVELTALHRDGHEFPILLALVNSKVHSTKKESFGTAFVRDITEHKKMENNDYLAPANLQRAILDAPKWLQKIEEQFSSVQHKIIGEELYVYASK